MLAIFIPTLITKKNILLFYLLFIRDKLVVLIADFYRFLKYWLLLPYQCTIPKKAFYLNKALNQLTLLLNNVKQGPNRSTNRWLEHGCGWMTLYFCWQSLQLFTVCLQSVSIFCSPHNLGRTPFLSWLTLVKSEVFVLSSVLLVSFLFRLFLIRNTATATLATKTSKPADDPTMSSTLCSCFRALNSIHRFTGDYIYLYYIASKQFTVNI